MILITVINHDGSEGATFPHKNDNEQEATEKFLGFLKANPVAALGAVTAKIRRVVELEELSEITLPELVPEDLVRHLMDLLGKK